ncbi:MAG: beta strand repeat-containing protein [Phycisphaerales bacterium]
MNRKHLSTLATIFTISILGAAAGAAQVTWNGGGADSNWTTGLNWGGAVPATTDNVIFMNTATPVARRTVNTVADQTVNSVMFWDPTDSTSNSWQPIIGTSVNSHKLTITTGNITTYGAPQGYNGRGTIEDSIVLPTGVSGTWAATGVRLQTDGSIYGDSTNTITLTTGTTGKSWYLNGNSTSTYTGNFIIKSGDSNVGAGGFGSAAKITYDLISGGQNRIAVANPAVPVTITSEIYTTPASAGSMVWLTGGTVRLSGALTGKTSITYNGSGTGTMYIGDSSLGSQPVNTNTGGISTQYGTMIIDKTSSLPASATVGFSVGGNSTTSLTKLLWNVADTVNNPITIYSMYAPTLLTYTATLGSQHTSGTLTLADNVTLGYSNGTINLTAATGGLVDITGLIKPNTGVTNAGIIKVGSGIVKLSKATGNTYNGGTTVTAGTLLVNNTTGSGTGTGAVAVQTGATLGGSGFITGNVTSTGGILAPGNSPGTLTVGGLVLDGASVLSYELDATDQTVGSNINDLIEVNGNLTLDGTFNLASIIGGSQLLAGSYRLINYTGSLTDNTLDLGTGLPLGYTYTIDTATNGEVNLVIIPEPATLGLLALGGLLMLPRRR